MKSAIISMLAFVGMTSAAQAEVKPQGYIYTRQCGLDVSATEMPGQSLEIREICTANINGGHSALGIAPDEEVIVVVEKGVAGSFIQMTHVFKATNRLELEIFPPIIKMELLEVGCMDQLGIFQASPTAGRTGNLSYVGTPDGISNLTGTIGGDSFQVDKLEIMFHTQAADHGK